MEGSSPLYVSTLPSLFEYIIILVFQVISQNHVSAWSCGFMDRSRLKLVTILQTFVAMSIVVVGI